MPELPEVETVRAGLAPALTNATVMGVDVLDSRSLKRHPGGVKDFQQTMIGAKVLGVVRRGKFLWLPLEVKGEHRSLAMVGHLGMSGKCCCASQLTQKTN
jgi:formamidopyrimidine-DNA glycosylase